MNADCPGLRLLPGPVYQGHDRAGRHRSPRESQAAGDGQFLLQWKQAEIFIRVMLGFSWKGVLAGPNDMIICVIRRSGVRRSELVAKRVLAVYLSFHHCWGYAGESSSGAHREDVRRPSNPWRDSRHVDGETEGDVLPLRWVESGCPVFVPVGLWAVRS